MTAPELKSCPFCGCVPDGYDGRQVSCRCGAMGPIETPDDPECATWNDAHKHNQAAIAAETMEALNAVILTIMEYNMRYGINDGHNDLTDEISAMKGRDA